MTKAATIDTRKVLGLVLAAAMVVATLLVASMPKAALADTEDTMSGQFAIGNSAPNITAVGVYEHDNVTAVTSGMNPQDEYIIKVTVSDANTMNDLDTCNVTLFCDNGNDSKLDIPSDNYTHAVTLHWTVGNAAPTITSGGSTTWDVGLGSEAPSLTAISGTFCFHVVIGKCAVVGTDWDAYAVVCDDSGESHDYYDSTGYDVNWYGEISTTDSVNWGEVAAGTDFGESTKVTGKSVTYISNGAYDEEVAASTSWGAATLNISGNPGPNEFSIRANDVNSTTGWQLLASTSSYVKIDETGIITDEDGDTVATNTLWLKLGTPFVDNTYNGTIYFKITNGS